MKRSLWIGLAVVGGLSLYLSGGEGEDELLAPARQGAEARAGRAPRASGAGAQPAAKTTVDAEVARALTEGVTAWLTRGKASQTSVTLSEGGSIHGAGWAAIAPPLPATPPRIEATETIEAPPAPPPFTHEWVGRLDDLTGNRIIERAVLSGPRNTLVVKAGDVIGGQWRVDSIHQRTMSLTYLPLNLPQTVAMK